MRLPTGETIARSSPDEYPEDGKGERDDIRPALVVCEDDFRKERADGESDYPTEDGHSDLHARSVTDLRMQGNALSRPAVKVSATLGRTSDYPTGSTA